MARPEFIPLVKVYYHSMLATIFSWCIDINKNDKNIQKTLCMLFNPFKNCISNMYFEHFKSLFYFFSYTGTLNK